MHQSIYLSLSSIFTKVRKFFFPEKHLTQIKVLSSNLQPIPNIEVTVVGIGKQNTDDHGNAVFSLSNEDYYAVDIGSGELREILYEEILKPGKNYSYVQDADERQGRIHVLHERT